MAEQSTARPETKEVFSRLTKARRSQKDLALALNLDANKISKIKSGERQFKGTELLRAYAWLDEAEQLAGQASTQSDVQPTRSADGGETASVTRLDLSYAMGPGTNLDDSHVEGEAVLFDIGFLRTLTPTPPAMLRIVSGVGDSMLPTIHDREELIIDTAQRVLNMQDRIWAIALFGAGALKRLRAVGKKRVLVISDNPDVPDQEVDASDIAITGRLVGSIKRH